MTKTKLPYIITTALFALMMLPGAGMNLAQPQMVVEMAETLGIPLALLTLIGVWKLLGVAALVTPGLDRRGPHIQRLREWAYAGFFFDLTGAAFLHMAVGDFNVVTHVVFLSLLLGSYVLRTKVLAQGEASSMASGLAASPA